MGNMFGKCINKKAVEALRLGWLTGFEPATFGTTIRRSNLLSYNHHGNQIGIFAKGDAKLQFWQQLEQVFEKYFL